VTVVGRGRHWDRFEGIIHPRFTLQPFIHDRGALARLYAEHDVFLAPSRHETFGLAALEAAAAGLVVVGPDAGGTGELLRQMESPFIFPAGGVDAARRPR